MLQRAIESIRASSTKPILIIAVVNGDRFDVEVCDWLKAQPDIRYEYVSKPSAPNAVLTGRQLVNTIFFSTLDDDDEYLPGTTDLKVAALLTDLAADFLVANACQFPIDSSEPWFNCLADVPSNPLRCLMQFNWLLSGNALYRTSAIGVGYFEDAHPYAEWTWLAFRFAMDKLRVAILDVPTFRYYVNTAGSLSKSMIYAEAYVPLFRRMLACAPPPEIATTIHRKIGAAHHDASEIALHSGDRFEAWRHHLRSLIGAGGFRYLAYTRHLLK